MKRVFNVIVGLSLAALPLVAQQQPGKAPSDSQPTRRPSAAGMAPMGMMGGYGMRGHGMGGYGMTGGYAMMGRMMDGYGMGGLGMMGACGMGPAMTGVGIMTMPGYGAMMQGPGFSPSRLLAARDALALTADQVSRLEQLQRSAWPSRDEMQSLWDAQQALRAAVAKEPADAAAIQQATQNLATIQAGMTGSRLASVAAARALLTPAQRDKWITLTSWTTRQGGGMQPSQRQQRH